jgi:hypothetical protein
MGLHYLETYCGYQAKELYAPGSFSNGELVIQEQPLDELGA